MSTKARWWNSIQTFFDPGQSYETVLAMAPIWFEDDFMGKVISTGATNYWGTRTVGTPGAAALVSAANGLARLPLAATSEAETNNLDFNDVLPLQKNLGLIIELRVALHVLPTGNATIVFGLSNAYNAVPGSITHNVWFRFDAATGGLLQMESKDGTHTNAQKSTGLTWVIDVFHVCRIDLTTLTDVRFYVDGADANNGQTFDFSATPTTTLQPQLELYKASGTGVGTLDLDVVKVWSNRA
jgi:hypothetical protein